MLFYWNSPRKNSPLASPPIFVYQNWILTFQYLEHESNSLNSSYNTSGQNQTKCTSHDVFRDTPFDHIWLSQICALHIVFVEFGHILRTCESLSILISDRSTYCNKRLWKIFSKIFASTLINEAVSSTFEIALCIDSSVKIKTWSFLMWRLCI